MLKLRKANESDLDTVYEIYKLAIKEMDKNNIRQWDNVYPNKDILEDDILNLKMYEKAGYLKVGETNWRKGLFYLFEKLI